MDLKTTDDFLTEFALGKYLDPVIHEVVPIEDIGDIICGYTFHDPPSSFSITHKGEVLRVTSEKINNVCKLPFGACKYSVAAKHGDFLYVFNGSRSSPTGPSVIAFVNGVPVTEAKIHRYDLTSFIYSTTVVTLPFRVEAWRSCDKLLYQYRYRLHGGEMVTTARTCFVLIGNNGWTYRYSIELNTLTLVTKLVHKAANTRADPERVVALNNRLYVFGYRTSANGTYDCYNNVMVLSDDHESWDEVQVTGLNSMTNSTCWVNNMAVNFGDRVLVFDRFWNFRLLEPMDGKLVKFKHYQKANQWQILGELRCVSAFYDPYQKKLVVANLGRDVLAIDMPHSKEEWVNCKHGLFAITIQQNPEGCSSALFVH